MAGDQTTSETEINIVPPEEELGKVTVVDPIKIPLHVDIRSVHKLDPHNTLPRTTGKLSRILNNKG